MNLIEYTNLDDFTMTVCMLVQAGFGTKAEIEALDTDEFLDLVEFMQIRSAIERHQIDEARRENGSR